MPVLPSAKQHVGKAGELLAGQLSERRLHNLFGHHLLKHGRIHAPSHGQRYCLVSLVCFTL